MFLIIKKYQKEKGQECSQEESSSTRIMHQPTLQWLPWQRFMIVDSNLYLIHLIRQTWPPLTFICSSQMKKTLAGRHFASDDDVIVAVEEFLESQTKTFFYTGIKGLQHRWSKCSANEGDYVEK